MDRTEYSRWNQRAINGTISDELNPSFILSGVEISLLVQIANDQIDMVELAKRSLENMGLDINGNWVGFKYEIK